MLFPIDGGGTDFIRVADLIIATDDAWPGGAETGVEIGVPDWVFSLLAGGVAALLGGFCGGLSVGDSWESIFW